jgi:hypothetical protein
VNQLCARLPLVGDEPPRHSGQQRQRQNQTLPMKENQDGLKVRTASRWSAPDRKISQKGAFSGGRFAPAYRLILYEK